MTINFVSFRQYHLKDILMNLFIVKEYQIIQKYRNELNIVWFHFSNGFERSDVDRCEKLDNLSITLIELNFYHEGIKWKHKRIPIEISRNNSDRAIDLMT